MIGLSHINPPAWLEKNWLFRKLFLLRKLYFTKRKFTHYSGAAEDISIRKLFPNNHIGVYVDVGCYHPIKYSNTWALYRKGWRGVNLDIDDIKIELFDMVRHEDINITCAVSDKSEIVKYYRAGLFSQINSINADQTEEMDDFIVKEVRSKTLSSILDETKYKNQKIDLLSIDVEGHDFEVISSLDFDRYQPSLIVIECYEPILERVEKTKEYRFLNNKGYSLVGWCGQSLLMASGEFKQKLVELQFDE